KFPSVKRVEPNESDSGLNGRPSPPCAGRSKNMSRNPLIPPGPDSPIGSLPVDVTISRIGRPESFCKKVLRNALWSSPAFSIHLARSPHARWRTESPWQWPVESQSRSGRCFSVFGGDAHMPGELAMFDELEQLSGDELLRNLLSHYAGPAGADSD